MIPNIHRTQNQVPKFPAMPQHTVQKSWCTTYSSALYVEQVHVASVILISSVQIVYVYTMSSGLQADQLHGAIGILKITCLNIFQLFYELGALCILSFK